MCVCVCASELLIVLIFFRREVSLFDNKCMVTGSGFH